MTNSCAHRWLLSMLCVSLGCMADVTRPAQFRRAPTEPDPIAEVVEQEEQGSEEAETFGRRGDAATAMTPIQQPSQPATIANLELDPKPVVEPMTSPAVVAPQVAKPAEPKPPSKFDDLAVRLASREEPVTLRDWNVALAESIASLEKKLSADPAHSADDVVRLRLLYLAAGRHDDASRLLTGVNSSERAVGVQAQLRRALDDVTKLAPLAVGNLAFCTEISSYGVYTPFAKSEFKPGQQVLLYAELENLATRETLRGHHTALTSRYRILDAEGRELERHDLPSAQENCKQRRRDYFIRYFLGMPSELAPGRYTLELTIDDKVGEKSGSAKIDFVVGREGTTKAPRHQGEDKD